MDVVVETAGQVDAMLQRYVHREGAAVYKCAIARMAGVVSELMARNKL
jgi:hypothetical protein